MLSILRISRVVLASALCVSAVTAGAQSFRVQCPTSTITHPSNLHDTSSEPAYTGPTTLAATAVTGTSGGFLAPTANVNGAIKCQQISGGDGYASMADGTQTYLFSFGPLSGITDIALGKPGTQFPSVFNARFPVSTSNYLVPGDPATTVGAATVPLTPAQLTTLAGINYNGAVGLDYDIANLVSIFDLTEDATTSPKVGLPAGVAPSCTTATCYNVTVVTNTPLDLNLKVGDLVVISGQAPPAGDVPAGFTNGGVPVPVTRINVPNAFFPNNFAFQYQLSTTIAGLGNVNTSPTAAASIPKAIDGHVDPRQIMDVGVMNGNIPAPLMAIDEDDEFFLTLTNVGMIMRPDLFEQHTVHFHGYPNASAFYDGVPDASVAINIAASFTYYYLAPDAGTYFWHCHITPPEHLQMGMVGQLYVRPRQNRVAVGGSLYTARQAQDGDLRTACVSANDILCSHPLPATTNTITRARVGTTATPRGNYAYNDGDGSTYYDVEYPLQMHGFDPNFHFVGMTFNPEGFADMKDKYFLLNGRSYPDTVSTGPLQTQSADGVNHFSQPLSALIDITAGQRALLRISDLVVSEYHTLASLGIPMQVVGYNAKLLRDQAGNNLYYTTNSITLGGGESLDVILDTCLARSNPADPSSSCTTAMATGTYYLYTPNLDHLSNDAENFGGQMTEVHVN